MATPSSICEALLLDPGFAELRSWVVEHTGLSYYQDKPGDFALALERSLGGRECGSARAILSRLQDAAAGDLDRLVEELTIGETFFFRHLEMFEALKNYVVPDLLERKAGSGLLRIWSAGCSVGAEPYSLAILLKDRLKSEFRDWKVEIIATDINRRFLKVAEAGVYEAWALRGLPEAERQRCFVKEGTKWVVRDEFRAGVKFRHHNLATDSFPSAVDDLFDFDLVVCRNVMIYFDQPTIRKLVGQFHSCLTPSGWLAVGHAEPHTEIFRDFHTINAPGAVLYQRDGQRRYTHSEVFPVHGVRASRPEVPPEGTAARYTWTPPILAGLGVISHALPKVSQPGPPAVTPDDLQTIRVLANTGELAECRDACLRLVKKEPLHAEVHFYLGLVYLQLGQLQEAGLALRSCLYLKRDVALAHYYLGLIHENRGEKSYRDFRNALDLLDGQDEGRLMLWGDGLTAGELQALLNRKLATMA